MSSGSNSQSTKCTRTRSRKACSARPRLPAREKIFDNTTLPYITQLVPLSAICAVLGPRFEDDPIKRRLLRWYWCGVFGELYGGANESRFANDIQDVLAWIDGGDEPRTIRESNFRPDPTSHSPDPAERGVQGIDGPADQSRQPRLSQRGTRSSSRTISTPPSISTTYFPENTAKIMVTIVNAGTA